MTVLSSADFLARVPRRDPASADELRAAYERTLTVLQFLVRAIAAMLESYELHKQFCSGDQAAAFDRLNAALNEAQALLVEAGK